jgi:amino acid adenylation domain-containing protein
VCGAEVISYKELDERANKLARHLRQMGVGAEVRVGVLMRRSTDLVVSLLAVLKAGGVYVPLDAEYPLERLSLMLEDSGAAVLLTQGELSDRVPSYWGQVVVVDEEWAEIEGHSGERLEEEEAEEMGGERLAYIIYTSGSTGEPKGVMVEQRAVARLVLNTDYVSLSPSDRVAQISNSSFDAITFELWGALLNGAQLVVIDKETVLDLRRFASALTANQITAMFMTTALFNQLAHTQADVFKSLRYVLFGGEAADAGSVRLVLSGGKPAHLLNAYGPTENTTFSTWHEVIELDKEATSVPIGQPIANTTAYVLDEHYRLTPEGMEGELYLGGEGVARGYLNRPSLTAERFVSDPFSTEPGARLYRTGDVVKRTAGGNLEFVGRRDGQVKVRGFRIELGEIQAVLRTHQLVNEAAVIASGEGADKRLVAYVACEGGAEAGGGVRWRDYLSTRLPDYMVPQSFVCLDALPLTPNGKVNRKALPEPDFARAGAGDEAATLTPVEEMLAGLVCEVLGAQSVGLDDDFFELGGHSLLATQLMSRVRDTFEVEIALRQFFESPTVGELARQIEAARAAGRHAEQVPPVVPVERTEHLPLSFAQRRLWFINKLEPGSALYNVSAAVRLTGSLDVESLARSLSEVVRRHESLRTHFAEINDREPVQIIEPPAPLRLTRVDLSGETHEAREAEAARLIEQEAQRPYDLSTGPLLRISLIRLDEGEHILAVMMHHIISDGWSMGVLVREVAALYSAFVEGQPSPLAELEVQYADFAAWQREWMSGEVLELELQYWRRRLAGAAVLELPADHPRPAKPSFRGAKHAFTLPADLSEAVRALSRREGATLFMTLLAAFQTLLHRHTGQTDIVLGTDVANRNRAATEPLLGFFVNQLVLRTDLSGNPNFRELLGRVRGVTLDAYAHQDLPFDKLIEALRPDRKVSLTPLFQAKLVLQNAPMPPLELPGLTLAPIDNGNASETAKFDLLLTLMDTKEGLCGVFEYSSDLFESATIERLAASLEVLLGDITARPEANIDELEIFSEAEKARRELQKKEREAAGFKKFKSVRPKAVSLSQKELVKMGTIPGAGRDLPLLIEPAVENVDVNLVNWVRTNIESVEKNLMRHGGILFRGFDIANEEKFGQFTDAIDLKLMRYAEGATPRTELGNKIYTSTEYPADQSISLHNELTYVITWPMRILFCCAQAPEYRGETPIADVRRVYDRIDPKIIARFAEKGWMLVRNFGDGLSLPWQTSFHTTEESEVEAYCRRSRIECEWKDGGGLRTRQVRPAVARHPRTGESVWFNHVAFWHVSSLEESVREAMLAIFPEDELPYNTYYGDGTVIEDSVVEEIRAAYREETVEFAWERGDVMLLDNMLVAHGRSPYRGERRILAAMGDGYGLDD